MSQGLLAVALGIIGFGYRYLSLFTEFSNDHFVNLSRAQQWLLGSWPELQTQYPRLAAHVLARYREVARFTAAFGRDLLVLADTGRAVRRRFGTSWPCFTEAGGT